MKKLFLPLFIISFLLSSCVTNVYLCRHAERLNNSSNTPLSDAGFERANTLKDTLANKKIKQVFATPYLRTQQTAQPTADAFGKELTIYGTDTTYQFVQKIKKIKGENILVVGHSNTVPEMILYMTGDTVHIDHDEFDDLYQVKISRGWGTTKLNLNVTKYGE